MKWFRVYDSVLDDPKVQLLPLDLRWRWLEALCIASRNSERGYLPSIEHLAFHFKVSIEEADAIVRWLIDAGLIDKLKGSKKLRIHGWDERQRKTDDSNERVKRHRKRTCNVTGNVSSNGPETLPRVRAIEAEAEQSRADTEAEAPLPPTGGENAAPPPLENPPPDEFPEFPEEATSMFMIMPGDHRLEEIEAREVWGHLSANVGRQAALLHVLRASAVVQQKRLGSRDQRPPWSEGFIQPRLSISKSSAWTWTRMGPRSEPPLGRPILARWPTCLVSSRLRSRRPWACRRRPTTHPARWPGCSG